MNKIRWLFFGLIYIFIYNVGLIIYVDQTHKVFWVSYFFVHFSYFLLFFSFYILPRVMDYAVISFPVIFISLIYFVVESVVGTIFIATDAKDFDSVFFTQLLLLGAYGIILVLNFIANHQIKKANRDFKSHYSFINKIIIDLDITMDRVEDVDLKLKISQLIEDFRNSEVKSLWELGNLEKKISYQVHLLRNLILTGDKGKIDEKFDEVKRLLVERNKILSNFKTENTKNTLFY